MTGPVRLVLVIVLVGASVVQASIQASCPGRCSNFCAPACSGTCCATIIEPASYQASSYQAYAPSYSSQSTPQVSYYNQPSPQQADFGPAACPAACPRSCYPECKVSCCKPAPTPPPTPPPPPACPASCPASCYPDCRAQCCDPKPPPMPLYLKRKQKTAVACEGHKLKIECPNKYDRIILYSTFYGRKNNDTCKHKVIPSRGYCADQEMNVNEKVFDLCGHERRCLVSAHNRFLAKGNSTICPGLYKYLKVVYKCSQYPRLFLVCPLPCHEPKACFPKCTADCCSSKVCPGSCPNSCSPSCSPSCCSPPPPPPARCPAACPSHCTPPCTPECCYGPQQMYSPPAPSFAQDYGQQQSPIAARSETPRPAYDAGAQRFPYYQPKSYASQRFMTPQVRSPYSSYQNYARSMIFSGCPSVCRTSCTAGCPRNCCTPGK